MNHCEHTTTHAATARLLSTVTVTEHSKNQTTTSAKTLTIMNHCEHTTTHTVYCPTACWQLPATSARWQLTTSTHYCGAIHRTEHHRHPRGSVLSADHHLLATTWARLASSTLSNVKITRRTPLAAVFPSQRQWQLTPLVPWPSKWRDVSAKLSTSHCPTLG